MPSVKMPRHSTDTDMTPFVDIAFLILSFFIMATKFKPKEPIQTEIPNSVSAEELPENDAMMVLIDSTNRVFFAVLSEKDKTIPGKVLDKIGSTRQMTFTADQKESFRKAGAVGVPFSQLSSFLDLETEEQAKIAQPGIPVTDTLDNQLIYWIGAIKQVYAEERRELKYLVKGDGMATYPTIEAVIAAFKRNDQLKFNLVTSLENAPTNSDLDKYNRRMPAKSK
ncbi:MAG: biopolymer transporter ExbD [Chitinophagaceae bacterium]|nr:biopolymer transporter ExbD [Chitinophagaceae bacterium]